jgi:hypothetical protein
MLEDWLVSTLPYCQLILLSPGQSKCTSMAVPSLKIGLLGPFFLNKQTIWPFHNSAQIANAFMQPNFDAKIFPAKLISQNLTCSLDYYCNGLPLSALCRNSDELPFNTSANFHALNKMAANFPSMSAEGQPRSDIVQFSTTQVVHQRQSVSASHLSQQVELAPCQERSFVDTQDNHSYVQLLWSISKFSNFCSLAVLPSWKACLPRECSPLVESHAISSQEHSFYTKVRPPFFINAPL